MEDDNKATPEEIERAREIYDMGDDLEIDDGAAASRSPDGDGVWVAAWVWLPADEG